MYRKQAQRAKKQSVKMSSMCRLTPPENDFRLTFVIQTKRFDDSFFSTEVNSDFVYLFALFFPCMAFVFCRGPIERRLCSTQSEFVSSESAEFFLNKLDQYHKRSLRLYTRQILINSPHISENFFPNIPTHKYS